jgi:flagellar basal-body rod protein FlgF
VDIVANNLANADTLGFKKDAPTFREYLSTSEREQGAADIAPGPIKDRDLYHLDGRDQAFVIVDGTYTNFKQGNLRVTQSPLDVALDGQGFLEVSTPSGVRYTRQGSLHVASDGRLVTNDGHPVLSASPGGLAAPVAQPPVLGQNGLPIPGRAPAGNEAARFINLRDRGTHFTISAAGEIYAGDELLGKLSVVEFQDQRKLRKGGGQFFDNPDPTNIAAGPGHTQVRQGILETSNVNPIEEMTNLIKANRLFEHDLKAMKTYGEIMGREANDIGKI